MTLMKVGDWARGVNFIMSPRNGILCQIIGDLRFRQAEDVYTGRMRSGLAYKVRWPDGTTALVKPQNLAWDRMQERELDKIVSWKTCGWVPAEIRKK